jgi:hypothetical protein
MIMCFTLKLNARGKSSSCCVTGHR